MKDKGRAGAEIKVKKKNNMKRKKKGQNIQTAAETSDAIQRQFWSGMIPLAAFRTLIPQSAVLTDPNGSKGWDVRQMRSHARV